MISINDLSVQFGETVLFDSVSFFIGEKDKIGLVGKNGAGKSTLLKIVKGVDKPTSGNVTFPKEFTVGYLPQEMQHSEETSILEEVNKAFERKNEMEMELAKVNEELGTRTDYESDGYMELITRLGELTDSISLFESENLTEQVEKTLLGLGFVATDFDKKMSEFSGGWKMRAELAKILLQSPDLLLLDEPTNHLDIESIEWLEKFLTNNGKALLMISHDKTFLDRVTKRTIEISKARIYDYKFSYSKYLTVRQEEIERQRAAQKQQTKKIAETQELINKFRAKKNKAAFAQSLIKKLDKTERIEVDEIETRNFKIRFPEAPRSGKVVVETEQVNKAYEDKKIFEKLDFIIGRGEKLALVGKNGMGKTTLIKMLANEENYEGEITIGHNVSMGYYAQNQTDYLDVNKTAFATIDDEAKGDMRRNVRGLLGSFLFSGDDIEKKVKVLSGGEKARLALCKLMLEPHNFLVMDEPTNHLDIASKEVLKKALAAYNGTLLIVSHDRDFLSGLTDQILEVKNHQLTLHPGTIYEFLEAKQAESINAFEQSKKLEKKQKTGEPKNNYQEKKEEEKNKKRLKNTVRKCEQEIEKLEKRQSELSEILAKVDYGNDENSSALINEYESNKTKIEELMKTWELAENELSIY